LRAIPNLIVIRPADSNETAQAWRVALKRKDGPTALILTRQAVPLITPANNPLEKGAYILADTPDSSKPKVILIATGSEVSLAMSAREQLNSQGVFTRVVSIPSWELFDDQTEEYRQSVLPPDVKARLAVEAGVTLAWSKLVGLQGCALGVDRFGASAPYKTLYTKYGLTVEAIVKAALDLS
jgi:transketolase